MQFFDGNLHAKKLEEKIKAELSKRSKVNDKVEGELAIILIGDNPSSEKYVSLKQKVAKRLGIKAHVYRLDSSKMQNLEILVKGSDITYSPSVTGVIVQLPLPSPRLYSLLTKIPYEKDVDMLSEGFKKKFYSGDSSRYSPVVRAVEYFLDSNKLKIEDKDVLVVGAGELVGKPVAFYLEKRGAKVQITENYKAGEEIKASLIVLSTGIPNLVRGENISDGCHVIDFGSSVTNGKVMGDLDLNSNLDHLGVISASPGGMGPLVVRYLFMNFLGI